MKKGWEQKPFESCIQPVEYTRKVQRKDFLNEGQFPIVSQEAEFTNGYWNDEADVFKVSTPVVIFGDHTQVLKYVDFDFAPAYSIALTHGIVSQIDAVPLNGATCVGGHRVPVTFDV